MSAIAHTYKCANCHASFRAPETPEFSYGLFVMRTERADDAAYLDAPNDSVFLESYALVKQHELVANLGAKERGDLQQAIFTVTCDLSPHGEPFKIGLLPRCPVCGSREMESWEPLMPVQEWILPAVGHKAWDTKTPGEKTVAIDQAVRMYFGKTA